MSSRLRLSLLMPFALVLACVPAAHGAVPRDFVGVSSEDAFAGEGHYRSATMAEQRSIGVGLLRQVLDWTNVETSPGRYDFTVYDGYMREAAAHGIAVLPVLFNPPPFYRRDTGRAACPPQRLSQMANYARAAVRRYGPGGSLWREQPSAPSLPVHSWQIWNEPSLGIYWCNRPSPRGYARMLRVVGRAIKSVDPGAEIATAGLPDSKQKSAMPLDRFLKRLYRAHGKRYFDTLAINGYATGRAQLSDLLHRVRRQMNRRGDRRARIWMTEMGWGDVGPPNRFIVGPLGQASRIKSSFALVSKLRRKLRLRGLVYYSWRDARPYPPLYKDMWGLHTGLLDVNGNPKPAFGVFRQAVAALR